MFSQAAALRNIATRTCRFQRVVINKTQHRNMGGAVVPHHVHQKLGEFCGFVCWMWIFYRARKDVPVLLRWRHPWDHHDPWDISSEADDDDQYELDKLVYPEGLIDNTPLPAEMVDDDDDDNDEDEDEDDEEDNDDE